MLENTLATLRNATSRSSSLYDSHWKNIRGQGGEIVRRDGEVGSEFSEGGGEAGDGRLMVIVGGRKGCHGEKDEGRVHRGLMAILYSV